MARTHREGSARMPSPWRGSVARTHREDMCPVPGAGLGHVHIGRKVHTCPVPGVGLWHVRIGRGVTMAINREMLTFKQNKEVTHQKRGEGKGGKEKSANKHSKDTPLQTLQMVIGLLGSEFVEDM